jgi:SHS2 domain-containing protein
MATIEDYSFGRIVIDGIERCRAEAVLGMVEGFADTAGSEQTAIRECHIAGETDEQLLPAVLDEVICQLEIAGELPVDADVRPADDGVVVRFAMADVESVRPSVRCPKAVSLHELDIAPGPAGWTTSVTVDV